MFHNILVPLDGSENANRTLTLAANLAKQSDSQINVLSVFRHHSHIEASISIIRPRDPENIDDVLSAHAKVVVDNGKAILREQGVKKLDALSKWVWLVKRSWSLPKNEIDLIVISSKGRGDLTGYLLGGVPHKVAGLAKCPVMVA